MPEPQVQPVYADTSFLVSHFLDDAFTKEARNLIADHDHPLMISALGRLEYRTALWQQVARDVLTRREARKAVAEFEKQAAEGYFLVPEQNEEDVWAEAEQLSDAHTSAHHLRSLDILHVAFAVNAGAERFWSFNDRQKRLAEAVGLAVNG